MRTRRKVETLEQRTERLKAEAQMRRDAIAADDAAVANMIRQNIRQFGP